MTLGASPAGLLLLALALVCAAAMMKAAADGDTTVKTTTLHHDTLNAAAYGDDTAAYGDDTLNAATYGDDTLNGAAYGVAKPASKSDPKRALVTTSSSTSTGAISSGAAREEVNARRALATTPSTPTSSVQVATAVVVGKTRLDFTKQVCVSVPKKARQKSATVWWKGGGDSSSALPGGQCAKVKFFSKAVCQGLALDSIVNPRTSGFPSTQKNILKWSSVASVLCELKVDSSDPACAALGCDPGGSCQVDQSGELFCQWDSPCGSCPRRATCKTTYNYKKYVPPVPVRYCECPEGSLGMNEAFCQASPGRASAFTFTVIANETAKDKASRPYTFRLDNNVCTQLPDAVAGKVTAAYYITTTNDYLPLCPKVRIYPSDHCFDDVFAEWDFGSRIVTSYSSYQDLMNAGDESAKALRNMRSAVCLVEGRNTYP
ncbi:unnamed protein product [Closterium sp. Yama58-4]|nr:unnamed protein product [Closterium sp. Yama58-4]